LILSVFYALLGFYNRNGFICGEFEPKKLSLNTLMQIARPIGAFYAIEVGV